MAWPNARMPWRRGGALTSQSKQIREIMTPDPVCCRPADSVQKAAAIMQQADTGIVPVAEANHRLTGVVTDRDLCLAVVAQAKDSHLVQVSSCMATHVICCHPEDPVEKALELMEANQIRRIPVIDDQGRIVGIVSMADVVRRSPIDGRQTHKVLEKICAPTAESSKPRAEMAAVPVK